MRKWTSSPADERESIVPKPTDAERVKQRARAFSRWVATKTRRAEEEQQAQRRSSGADR